MAAAGSSLRVVQAGQGVFRPLAVLYNIDIAMDAMMREYLGPEVAILAQTIAPSGGKHPVYDFPFIAPLHEVLLSHMSKLGVIAFGPVVLCGFSAGGGGPRSQLREGATPDGICILDGNHASNPPFVKDQIDPWRRYFDLARDGQVSCICTHTAIKTGPSVLSTTATLELITGVPMPAPAPGRVSADIGQGKLRVYGYGGVDAAAHSYQVTHVAAPMLRQTFRLLSPSLCVTQGCDLPFEPPPPPPPGKGPAGKPPKLETGEPVAGSSSTVKLAGAMVALGALGWGAYELATRYP